MLFPHQKEAIKWMRSIEEQPRIHEDQQCGGILAHEMGLGKTVTMLHFMSLQPPMPMGGLNLVICPKSVLMHWVHEAIHRASFSEAEVFLYYGSNRQTSALHPSVRMVLTTFDIVRTESSHKKTSLLFTQVWKRIVLDEAHRICERNSKTSKSISQLRGCNRWCLTGTPYKNGLSDIVALCKFLKIQPYCKASWWKHNAHNELSLKQWRSSYLHIRQKSTSFLPPLLVNNCSIENTVSEKKVQDTVKSIHLKSENKNKLQEFELLKILRMRQSAVHPFLFLSDAARDHLLHNSPSLTPGTCSACSRLIQESVPMSLLETSNDENSACVSIPDLDVVDGIDKIGNTGNIGNDMELLSSQADVSDDSSPAIDDSIPVSDDSVPVLDDSVPALDVDDGTVPIDWYKGVSKIISDVTLDGDSESHLSEPWCLHFENGTTSLSCAHHSLCDKCAVGTLVCPTCIALGLPQLEEEQWLHSSKTRELLGILQSCVANGDKVVLFSQWTSCLDLVQNMLSHYQLEYCRFDGTVSTIEERSSIVDKFGKSDTIRVMLTSLGAGGEGIDLTCANTVVLLEPYWNSAIEQQAIDRVHRLGQKDVTKVYKLTLQNSVEDWVLELQKLKQQEQHYYLKGTAPVMPDVAPANSSLGKRQQRLLDKVNGANSAVNGSWKKTVPSTLPKKGGGSMLSQFIF